MDARVLLLFRHAKSDWDAGAETDFDRPLARRGRKAAGRMGKWMADNGWIPDLVLSSPSARTRETLDIAFQAAAIDPPVEWTDALYLATPANMVDLVEAQPASTGTLMVVGHNPGMEMLTRYLAGDERLNDPSPKLFPTATLARFELPPGELYEGCAADLRIVRPRELPS